MNDLPQPSREITNADSGVLAWTHVIYGLHALSVLTGVLTATTVIGAFVFGWPSIIAVILSYLKRSAAEGTFLATHFRWQIRTFWFAFLWYLIAAVLFVTLIGIPIALIIIGLLTIWIAYRVIRGWMALGDGKPMRFDD